MFEFNKTIFIQAILFTCLIQFSFSRLYSQEKYSPELLWKLGRITEYAVSPDGRQVVYGVKNFNLKANTGQTDIWMVSLAGGEPKLLMQTPVSEVNIRWHPSGKKIGYLSAVGDSGLQYFEVSPEGKPVQQISHWAPGVEGFEYSPKGNYLLYTLKVKVGRVTQDFYPDLPLATGRIYDELMFRHWTEWADGHYSHLFIQPLGEGKLTGTPRDLLLGETFAAPTPPDGGLEEISWSPDETRLIYTCKKEGGTMAATSTNTDLWMFTLATESTENLTPQLPGYDKEPRFSPDGKSIVWLSMATPGYEADKNRIMWMDLQTRKPIEISAAEDQTFSHLVWSKDGKRIYSIIPAMGTEQVGCYTWENQKAAFEWITSGTYNYTDVQVTTIGNEENLVLTRTSMSAPADLYKVEPKSKKVTTLTGVNQKILSNVKTGEVKGRWIETTDKKKMWVWVIYPPNFDPAKKYPALLYCQGGPQSQVSQFFSYRWNFQLMAAQGYIVVAPNRRGLPGFGQAWNDEIKEDWGGQAYRDYLTAIDSVSAEPYVDKNRLGAVGASYGGYSVYWLASHHGGRFKTFISHCGVFNLETMSLATEEVFFVNREMGGPIYQYPRPESYDKFSPHKFAGKWETPILVIHGDKDFRVPVTEGIQAFTLAQLKGIPSRFLWFPDEGHWVTRPQNSVLWNRVFFDWLDQTLSPEK